MKHAICLPPHFSCRFRAMCTLFDKDSPVYGPFGPFGRSVFNDAIPLAPHCWFTGLLHRETGQPHGYGTKTTTITHSAEVGFRKVNDVLPDICRTCFADGTLIAETSSTITCGRWVNGVPHGPVHERSSLTVKMVPSSVLVSAVCFDGSLVDGVRHGEAHVCSMLDNNVYDDVYEHGKRIKRTLVGDVGNEQSGHVHELLRKLTAVCPHRAATLSPQQRRSFLPRASPRPLTLSPESNGLSPAPSGRSTSRSLAHSAKRSTSVSEQQIRFVDPLTPPPAMASPGALHRVSPRRVRCKRQPTDRQRLATGVHCGQHVVAVVDREDRPGVIMYVGPKLHGDKRGEVVGICADASVCGAHNGTVGGFQYFVCESGRGLLVPAVSVFPDSARRPFT